MRRARVAVGSESGRGASVMLARSANSVAERNKERLATVKNKSSEPKPDETPLSDSTIPSHPISKNPLLQSPTPVNRVDKNIFIGDHNAAKSDDIIRNYGITHVVNTAIEVPSYFEETGLPPSGRKIFYLNLGLRDDPTPGNENILEVLEPSLRYIVNVLKRNPDARILIHCHAGISRSSSIVVYYLMRTRGWDFDQSLEYLKSKRPIVNPNPWYATMLQDAHKLLRQRDTEK